ncbi:MAG: Uma2 family endonuclease [Ktedonobacterales bacterium]
MQHDTLAPWAERAPDFPERMTAAELLALPENGWRYELVAGRLIRMPPIGGGHGRASLKLANALDAYVEQHALGMVTVGEHGFILSLPGQPEQPETVLGADVAFVRAEHVPLRTSAEFDAYWRVAPDLVVEIVSPSQFRPEMAAKARLWLRAGVRLVWVVWPGQRQVDVWRPGADEAMATLNETDMLDGQEVVPGFTLPVGRAFS